MPTHTQFRSTLAALLGAAFCAACGSSSDVDPYNGVLFSNDGVTWALDTKFLPSTDFTVCKDADGNTYSLCYPVQLGYANGKPVQFYQLFPTIFASSTLPPPPVVSAPRTANLPDPIPTSVADHKSDGSGGAHAYVFPNSCTPNPNYDPRRDAYSSFQQGAVFDAIPNALPIGSTLFVWPVVATYGVTGLVGETCNDIKDSRSIGDKNVAGSFGARATDAPTSYQLWPVIDPNATLIPFNSAAGNPDASTPIDPSWGARLGWYKGLQLKYLDGGRIPTRTVTDPADATKTITTLVPMDAAVLNPSSSSFAAVNATKVIVFPASPGDDAWSPIVRLHNYDLSKVNKKPGDIKGICAVGDSACLTAHPNYLDAKAMATSSFNTLFVVAPPQQ